MNLDLSVTHSLRGDFFTMGEIKTRRFPRNLFERIGLLKPDKTELVEVFLPETIAEEDFLRTPIFAPRDIPTISKLTHNIEGIGKRINIEPFLGSFGESYRVIQEDGSEVGGMFLVNIYTSEDKTPNSIIYYNKK
jgi:hypothetical protein